jgi:aminobenzoyl-glutamate transport protein
MGEQPLSQRLLLRIELAGNRIPHPTLLFIYLAAFIALLSAFTSLFSVAAIHPVTGNEIAAKSLLTGEGLRYILTSAVKNFTGFAPVGTVLVAIMGIGVAEHSGLIRALLSATIMRAPQRLMTFLVVLTGVLSSIATDTGYVVLIPLAGMLFAGVNRNPVAGIAAAFAGVSGGFSANLLIGPLDAILAGISTEAAVLIDPSYEVSAAGNYYFIFASTFLVAVVGTLVTEKWVEPLLGASKHENTETIGAVSDLDKKGLRAVGWFSLAFVALLTLLVMPSDGVLRNPETGSVLRSPFISGVVVLVAVYGAIAGYLFGKVSRSYQQPSKDMIAGMEASMATMASYLVLMFFAAQFVNWFSWSQLGIITAITGADVLQALNPNSIVLLVLFVVLAAFINLLVGSASAKWALIAPIFVPMLLLSGITPEAAQVAYRIGDSSTNIITPLMPYFGVVVAFVQKYDKDAGIGTLLAAMLPYSIMFLVCWSIMLAVWLLLGIPLGPDAPAFIPQ